ncbi:MAG TPA: TonB-dependent receptor [Burkholderiales bacterium]|nr:TonB-dependent receptor [Burkholderiales bacterium]
MRRFRFATAALALGALVLAPPHAAGAEARLSDLSLEELSNVVITSVSRHDERLSDAAASVYVITGEDVRRSGARTLPEALRLAPNLQVARTGAGTYAISARGFNNALGNKLLVLIDGRTVYTPLFSGVFWDQQDVMLEDVERIEVISGPGATLWGANAVNGVINVITRSAQTTTGTLLAAGAGTRDYRAAMRYGGTFGASGASGAYRIYGKTVGLDSTTLENGTSALDGLHRNQVGFRADWSAGDNSFRLQGDAYSGKTDARAVGGSLEVSGMNLLGAWTRKLGAGSDLSVQTYYDRSERVDRIGFQGSADVFDVEAQHRFTLGRHRILWGGGYRHARDDLPPTLPPLAIVFVPQGRTLAWKNVFVQDEIALARNVELTLGVKAESNVYTGWEYLPSARIAWKPADNRLLWGALSRAVRAPARLDRDFTFVFTPLNLAIIRGGPNFQSEVAKVAEIGYRAQPAPVLSYSITAFRHQYEKLRSGMPAPAFIQNDIEGFANGVEAWAAVQPTARWRVTAGWSSLRQHLGAVPGSPDPTGPIALGNDPDHQWMLRSSLNLDGGHELDVMVRRVGSLPLQAAGMVVPAYTAVDARWGFHLAPGLEVSLTLQNLLDSAHPEFGTPPLRSEYRRSAFINLTVRR